MASTTMDAEEAWQALIKRRGDPNRVRVFVHHRPPSPVSPKPKRNPTHDDSSDEEESRKLRRLRERLPPRPKSRPLPPEKTLEQQFERRVRDQVQDIDLDLWLKDIIANSTAPDGLSDFHWLFDEVKPVKALNNDTVRVILWVEEEVHVDPTDVFEDDSAFTLRLRVLLPPSSGFLVSCLESPPVTLATWFGQHDWDDAPNWVVEYRQAPAPSFWIPRPQVLDIVRVFAMREPELTSKEALVTWCNAVTRGSFADLKAKALLPVAQHPPPPPLPSPKPTKAAQQDTLFRRFHARRDRLLGPQSTPTRKRSLKRT